MIFGFDANPIFDYILAMYSFGLFFIYNMIPNKINSIFKTIILLYLGFALVTWWNTLSGVIFYHVNWLYSLSFNGILNIINFVIIAMLLILIIKQSNFNKEIM